VKKIEKYIPTDNFFQYIETLKKKKKTFKVAITGYTTIIECENYKYYFTKSINGKSIFNLYNKLIKEIKDRTGDKIIERNKINYYKVSNYLIDLPFNEPIELPEVFNIDISGAYPQTLLNLNLCSQKLYSELMELDKIARLKIIGMIACSKSIYYYVNGNCESDEIKVNQNNRNLFFNIVNNVGECINKCSEAVKDDFLFYWVDGIYFRSEESKYKIFEIMKEFNYSYSEEKLKNFVACKKMSKREIINISYYKKEKAQPKLFNIPIPDKKINSINKKLFYEHI
jgi:hypothetical protein